ncbi:MAG: hypothetical protein JWP16_1938 [Alphaproteobacteria bacterium]|jgi:hypothetical protein|nr:hypothetical protein [Alphaproteobacteria bacterium]MDB5740898.1 hypothetical protein [Alphaproteobacteria bacterium]
MKFILMSALVIPLLGGCSGMLAGQALKEAQQKCAAKGGSFVQDDVEKHDNPIYSSATVTGGALA